MVGHEKAKALAISVFLIFLFANEAKAALDVPIGMSQDVYCETCEQSVKAIVAFNADENSVWAKNSPCLDKYMKRQSKTWNDEELNQAIRTCNHLVDLHGDEIKEKSINMSAQDLSILLCHERSHACLGLVPKHKKEKKRDIDHEEEIRKLIKKNKDRIRTPYPHHYKEEL